MSDGDGSFFKKIGIPASMIALLSTAFTLAVTMYAVDSRYAKSEDVHGVSNKIEELTSEVNKLIGITQVLVQVAGRVERTNAAPLAMRGPASLGNPLDSHGAVPNEDPIKFSVQEPDLTLSKVLNMDAGEARFEIQTATSEDLQGLLQQTTSALETSKNNLNRLSSD